MSPPTKAGPAHFFFRQTELTCVFDAETVLKIESSLYFNCLYVLREQGLWNNDETETPWELTFVQGGQQKQGVRIHG